MARYEVTQYLLQAVLAYSYNPNLEQYVSFALTLRHTKVRISKAIISRNYLMNFFQSWQIVEPIQLYRSEPLDILDREGRKEFLRFIMGVLRYLVDMEQSNIVYPV